MGGLIAWFLQSIFCHLQNSTTAAPQVDKPAGGEAKFSGKPSCTTTRWSGKHSKMASRASNKSMRTPANTNKKGRARAR